MTPEQIDLLIDDYFDGRLSAEQGVRFERALLADPAALDRLSVAGAVHCLLQDRYAAEAQDGLHDLLDIAGSEPSHREASPVMEMVIEQALALRRQHEIEDQANKRLAAQQKEDTRNRRFELRRPEASRPVTRAIVIPWVAIWLGFAALLGIVATMIYQVSPDPPIAMDPPPVVENAPQPQSAAVSPAAHLTGSFDAAWAWAGVLPTASGGLLPGRYTLTDGWAEVHTARGVELVLEAPVTFEVGADNAITLSRGQLVADVPEGAHGFTVHTPNGRVVDYGTTFGVEVNDAGVTLAHVFAGEISVAPEGPQAGQAVRLVADEAASFRRDREVRRIDAAPERFARAVPATSYQAAVMRSRPMCYWRGPIDETTRVVTDYGWLGAAGVATNISPTPGSTALSFRGSDEAVAVVPYQNEINMTNGFTVEAWVWVDRVTDWTQRFISMRSSDDAGWGFGVGPSLDPNNAGDGVLIFSFYGVSDIASTDRVPIGQWVHVAASIDPQGHVALYINGQRSRGEDVYEPQRLRAAGGGVRTGDDVVLRIGNGGHPDGPSVSRPYDRAQPLHGLLHDLVVYDRPLPPPSIAGHAQYHIASEP